MYMFMLSKFPELVDTVLLVLRGRPVPFLHWYHHITVLLYCVLTTRLEYAAFLCRAYMYIVYSAVLATFSSYEADACLFRRKKQNIKVPSKGRIFFL